MRGLLERVELSDSAAMADGLEPEGISAYSRLVNKLFRDTL